MPQRAMSEDHHSTSQLNPTRARMFHRIIALPASIKLLVSPSSRYVCASAKHTTIDRSNGQRLAIYLQFSAAIRQRPRPSETRPAISGFIGFINWGLDHVRRAMPEDSFMLGSVQDIP
jgi:hypothetical protein